MSLKRLQWEKATVLKNQKSSVAISEIPYTFVTMLGIKEQSLPLNNFNLKQKLNVIIHTAATLLLRLQLAEEQAGRKKRKQIFCIWKRDIFGFEPVGGKGLKSNRRREMFLLKVTFQLRMLKM